MSRVFDFKITIRGSLEKGFGVMSRMISLSKPARELLSRAKKKYSDEMGLPLEMVTPSIVIIRYLKV